MKKPLFMNTYPTEMKTSRFHFYSCPTFVCKLQEFLSSSNVPQMFKCFLKGSKRYGLNSFFYVLIFQNNAATHTNAIWDAFPNLVPFIQFKKREKHPWKSVTFSKVPGRSLKVTLLHGRFPRFFIIVSI